jgi:hypothetical protein
LITHSIVRDSNGVAVSYNILSDGVLAGIATHTVDGGFSFVSKVFGLSDIAYSRTMSALKAQVAHNLGGQSLVPAGSAERAAANAAGAAVSAATTGSSGAEWKTEVTVHLTKG